MKVLLISNMFPSKYKPTSGIFVRNQFEYLNAIKGIDIDLFYMKRKFTNNLGTIKKYIVFFIKFIPYLLKNKYNIIHVHFLGEHIYLALLYKFFHRKTKIIVTLHGRDIYKGHLFKYMNKVHTLISVSKYQNQVIKNKYNVEADRILCAGIDKALFYKKNNCNKKYDFLYVGSFFRVKGIDVFLKAIESISEKYRICFAGSGDYISQIRKLQQNSNSDITILEDIEQNELIDLYNQSKFLVFPSRDDSFGLVVTEALFSGTPAIVTDNNGAEEQIIDGYNGFIIPKGDSNALLNKLDHAYSLNKEDYEELSKNARQSNSEYSLQNVCNEIINIYDEANKY